MNTAAELDIGRELLYLCGADVEVCAVSAGDMNDAVEAALAAKAAGRARTRPKLTILQPDGSSFRAKADVLDDAGYAAIKWFGYFPGNAARGAPDFHPLVMVNETRTGLPVAMMDGVCLWGQRTAAFSAVAAKRLARPEPETLGFVACGLQARCNLAALRAEFPIRRVIACRRRRETAERFAAEVREQGLEVVITETPHDVVSSAKIVVTSVPHAAIEAPFLDATPGWRRAPLSQWSISASVGGRRLFAAWISWLSMISSKACRAGRSLSTSSVNTMPSWAISSWATPPGAVTPCKEPGSFFPASAWATRPPPR
jgi:ornithine cyclodeaminase/alanine dehydrogenase